MRIADGSELRVEPLNDARAAAIAEWEYEPPYDRYDPRGDPAQLDLLWDTERRRGLRVVVDEDGELVGYFNFLERGDEIHIGLAMAPDRTGRGLGTAFVNCGLDAARRVWGPARFRLWVAAFNIRAISVYERVGFRQVGTHVRENDGVEFLEMELVE